MSLRHFRCWLFGHNRSLEDMGGVVYEVCDRCNWVGRHSEYPIQIVSTSEKFGEQVAKVHELVALSPAVIEKIK